MKPLRARLILPLSSPPIEDGLIGFDGGKISLLGPYDGRPAHDLGEVILLPGLINAHCHLDYTSMCGAILPSTSFTNWIRRINDLKRVLDDGSYLASIASGFQQLLRSGTTTVMNIEAFPELMLRLPPPPLRTWWFYELIDIRTRLHTEDVVAGALAFFEERPGWLGGFGLSPHAPYTASRELYLLARRCCETHGMPLTTHVAESDEEVQMFRDAAGPLFEFLEKMGRPMSDTGNGSPLELLLGNGLLPDNAILAHMNHVETSDWNLMAGKSLSVVHCPCCHRYFDRPSFDIDSFLERGINICLGTDSLASNRQLNMFAEMRTLRHTHPHLPAELVLDLATRNGARALGRSGALGELRIGAAADLIAIPYSGSTESAADAVIEHPGPPAASLIAGHWAIAPEHLLPASAGAPTANRPTRQSSATPD